MKKRLPALILTFAFVFVLFAGCAASAAEQKLEAIDETIDQKLDTVEDTAKDVVVDVVTNEPPVQQSATKLTADEAKTIALNHGGFTADQVTWLRAEYEIDDGIPEYEIDFHSGDTEYDYTIHAETGEIRHWDKDYDPVKNTTTQPPATETPATEPAAQKLTAEEAQSIALTHADFTADQVTRLRSEYDIDDGIAHYDVEFNEGYREYDYEIHAESGKILSYDKDN